MLVSGCCLQDERHLPRAACCERRDTRCRFLSAEALGERKVAPWCRAGPRGLERAGVPGSKNEVETSSFYHLEADSDGSSGFHRGFRWRARRWRLRDGDEGTSVVYHEVDLVRTAIGTPDRRSRLALRPLSGWIRMRLESIRGTLFPPKNAVQQYLNRNPSLCRHDPEEYEATFTQQLILPGSKNVETV
jgi:hypothetical protein